MNLIVLLRAWQPSSRTDDHCTCLRSPREGRGMEPRYLKKDHSSIPVQTLSPHALFWRFIVDYFSGKIKTCAIFCLKKKILLLVSITSCSSAIPDLSVHLSLKVSTCGTNTELVGEPLPVTYAEKQLSHDVLIVGSSINFLMHSSSKQSKFFSPTSWGYYSLMANILDSVSVG